MRIYVDLCQVKIWNHKIGHITYQSMSCGWEHGYPWLGTYELGMGQNHSKPTQKLRKHDIINVHKFISSILGWDYSIMYQNVLHLHTSPFVSTLDSPPAKSRLLLRKEAAAPNTFQIALLLGETNLSHRMRSWS